MYFRTVRQPMRKRRRLTWGDVLCYGAVPDYGYVSRATVRKFYGAYREAHELPHRCDNEQCRF